MFILFLFLYLFLTHQTNFLTYITFIRIFNIAGPTMITVVFSAEVVILQFVNKYS